MYWPARNCRRSLAGSLRRQHHHIVGDALQLLHAAGQDLDRDVLGRADFAAFEHQVGERLGAAEQRQAGGALAAASGRCSCAAP